MYKISVPINCYKFHRTEKEKILNELRSLDADRVFLNFETAIDGHIYLSDKEKYAEMLTYMKDACCFFKNHGYEVGAWFWGLMVDEKLNFTIITKLSGDIVPYYACPTDANFVSFAQKCMKDVANTGVDIILLNDDVRFGAFNGFGCLCKNHITHINQITNEYHTAAELKSLILSGGKNKYRDALLQTNKKALEGFAQKMRNAVDEVNPDIRMGYCATMSSWDIDGTDAFSLARIFAGNTKPIVRLIGAPYWAVNKSSGNRLQDVIELERMESSWTQGNIELIAEGDVYPRPRQNCPASFLEGFDTAIRASGCTDGILKIAVDYLSNSDYETGYALFHEKNRPIYEQIDQYFSCRKPVGIRVYEPMKKCENLQNPDLLGEEKDMEEVFFSDAARTLACNAIPTTYTGEGITAIAFGEGASYLSSDQLKNGIIIDALAAKILIDHGIDTGVEFFGQACKAKNELFLENDNYILAQDASVYNIKLKENAEILSYAVTQSDNHIPMSFRYENQAGQRFLVLNFNTRNSFNVLQHYARSKQYADNIPWLSGRKLPAYSYGNPNLYIQCKEDDTSLVVGLWNFFEDEITKPIIDLEKTYKKITYINCTGELKANTVCLSPIPAFGFAAFLLEQ